MRTDFFPDTIDVQKRVRRWVESRLGAEAMGPHERAMRFLEESMELCQSLGVTYNQVGLMQAHVYSRGSGETRQEIGGVAVTIMALSDSVGELFSECGERELKRIENLPAEKFQRRQQLNRESRIGL